MTGAGTAEAVPDPKNGDRINEEGNRELMNYREQSEGEDIAEFWREVLLREEHEARLMFRAEFLRDPVPYEVFEIVWHVRRQELLRTPGDDGSEDGWFRVNPDR